MTFVASESHEKSSLRVSVLRVDGEEEENEDILCLLNRKHRLTLIKSSVNLHDIMRFDF